MRVLDLGCGAGDSTFVAADLVGPGGSVVRLDHSLERAGPGSAACRQRGLAQVQFIEGDCYDPAPGGPFDAIVERLALYQIPDPAEVLRRQAAVLCPGGLVVAMEGDVSTWRSLPETALYTQFVSSAVEGSPELASLRSPPLSAVLEGRGCAAGADRGPAAFGPGDEAGLASRSMPARRGAAHRTHRRATAEEIWSVDEQQARGG